MNTRQMVLAGSLLSALLCSIYFAATSSASPTCPSGSNCAAINVDATTWNVVIGTSTASSSARLYVVPLGSTHTAITASGEIKVMSGGVRFPDGVLQTVGYSGGGTVPAQNVTAGTFAAGNFAFQNSLGVATGSQIGLPQPLSVYGNGYISGNLGIGTASPGSKLEVNGDLLVSSGGGTQHIFYQNGNVITGYQGGNFAIGTNQLTSKFNVSGNATIGSGYVGTAAPANGMIVQGNVGIGTSGPSNPLNILSTSNPQFRISYDAANYSTFGVDAGGNMAINGGGTQLRLYNGNQITLNTGGDYGGIQANGSGFSLFSQASVPLKLTAGSANLTMLTGGYVGIGTATPSSTLTVAGEIKSTVGGVRFPDGTLQATAASTGMGGSGSASYIPKFTAGTTLGNSLIYDNGTNVGIGTASPNQKLDVNGVINAGSSAVAGEIRSVQGAGYSNYVSLKSEYGAGTNKSGIFRDNAGYFVYYDTGTGDINMDAAYAGASNIFRIGGSEKMRIANNGSIGINTTNPLNLVDVKVGTNQHLGVRSSGGITSIGTFNDAGGAYVPLGIDGSALYLQSQAGGNVGVGTTNATSMLTVAGEIKTTAGGVRFPDGTLQTSAGAASVPASNVTAGTFAAGNFSFQSSLGVATGSQVGLPQPLSVYGNGYINGNLGVGTASPSAKLDVVGGSIEVGTTFVNSGSITLGGFPTSIMFGNSQRIYDDGAAGLGINSTSSGSKITLSTTNGHILLSPGTANVGIGIASPGQKLEVAGNISSTQMCLSGVCSATWPSSMGGSGTGNYITKFTAGTTLGNSLMYDNGTNIGIGTTSPGSPLTIVTNDNWGGVELDSYQAAGKYNGIIQMSARGTSGAPTATQNGDYLGFYRLNGYSGSGPVSGAQITAYAAGAFTTISSPAILTFSTTPAGSVTLAERMRIDSAGNVGIGMTPSQKLDVSGNGNFSGTVTGSQFNGSGAGLTGTAASLTAGAVTNGVYTNSSSRWPLNTWMYSSGAGTRNWYISASDMYYELGGNGSFHFRNSSDADVATISYTGVGAFAAGTTVGGINLCLSNGTNCPAGGSMGGSGTTSYIPKFTGASTLGNSLIYDNGTSVGVGTTGPSANLDVYTNLPSQATYQSQWWSTNNVGYALKLQTLWDANGVYQKFVQRSASTDYDVLTFLAGNIGMGTIPSYKLDVNGVGRFSGGTLIGNGVAQGLFGDGTNFAIRSYNSGSSDTYFQTYNGAVTNMIIKNGGNIGVGTTNPKSKFSVAFSNDDELNIYSPGDNQLAIQTTLDNNALGTYGGGNNILSLQPLVGNVAIGTTVPAYKLQVGAGNNDGIMIGNYNDQMG